MRTLTSPLGAHAEEEHEGEPYFKPKRDESVTKEAVTEVGDNEDPLPIKESIEIKEYLKLEMLII